MNISKTIKDIATHLIYSESLQSQVFDGIFKDVPCGHRWLQQLPLFGPSVHPRLLEGEAHRPVLSQTPMPLQYELLFGILCEMHVEQLFMIQFLQIQGRKTPFVVE